MKREFVRAEDGQILMVVRPKDPERALAIAAKALEMQDVPAFQAIPQDPGGAYTFQGYLAKRIHNGSLCIVDQHNSFVGELVPGDSFVTPGALEQAMQARAARAN
jgi:hypothetical protein